MKSTAIHMMAGMFLSVMVAAVGYANGVIKVRGIEFRGLKYMGKGELLERASLKALPDGILVDTGALAAALSNSLFIKKFGISERDGILTISVEEKVPAMTLVVRRGDQSIPVELDGDFSVISVNRVHAAKMPVVVADDEEIAKGQVSDRVRRIFIILGMVKGKCRPLFDEIAEVHLAGKERITVHLRGRRASVRMAPSLGQFIKLQYLVGYFDGGGRQPTAVTLTDTGAFVR